MVFEGGPRMLYQIYASGNRGFEGHHMLGPTERLRGETGVYTSVATRQISRTTCEAVSGLHGLNGWPQLAVARGS